MTNLERIRRELNIKAIDLGRRAGLHPSMISLVERGYRTPTDNFRDRVSAALGVPQSILFGDFKKGGSGESRDQK